MAEGGAPAVFTIPPHRAFADALAAGVIARAGGDTLALARGVILLPTNRSIRAITDAFVRRAEGGLLLPRLVAIGDPDLDERLGALFDPMEGDPVPPAIAPIERRMILARLIGDADPRIDAAEAIRLAGELGRTLDQMIVEQVPPSQLRDIVPEALSDHWIASLDRLAVVLDRWPEILAQRGRIDLAERRNHLLSRVAAAWRSAPPSGFVIVAGIVDTAPAVTRMLRTISRMPNGAVILPGLDTDMPEPEWESLGPHEPDPETGMRRRSIEGHPQYQLKRMLDRIGVARGEVQRWRWGGGRDARAVRTRAIGNAMAPAAFTGKWRALPPVERRLSGVRAITLAGPAEEAQAIAIAMREAIETAGRTAALVTPDRGLARRVAAHLARWGIKVDDSAGVPVALTPPGTLLIGIAETLAERFAPVPLLALLKHPLVRSGEGRTAWLEGVRLLDRALRGPRPAPGLAGIERHLADGVARDAPIRTAAAAWWGEAAALLAPLDDAVALRPAALFALLRETAGRLAGDAAWAGPAGRAAAQLLTEIEAAADEGPALIAPDALPHMLRNLLETVAVRPPAGGHPRLFIWGLIEARLQHADLMILGGLNEGVWPAAPSPDPWLAPRIRADLGLLGTEARIGIAAHDFAMALGARDVLVTRARRDERAPAVASRLWLRMEAMTGGLARAPLIERWARSIDAVSMVTPARRPAPSPPLDDRPRKIAVTKLDRLKADPFAFYADAMLRLSRWDMPDADPTPAWRGTALHRVLEQWQKEDDCDPAKLRPRVQQLLDAVAAHPVLRTMWAPRLLAGIDWAAEQVVQDRVTGRVPVAAEIYGSADIDGIMLYGTADRIDRDSSGALTIVDYKTGMPPSPSAVAAGYAMQLGLLGLIVERGGFKDVAGSPQGFEYWSFAKRRDGGFGDRKMPVKEEDMAGFAARAAATFADAAARWLDGEEPFTAKLHPEYAPYADYDQLMRFDEWYGAPGS